MTDLAQGELVRGLSVPIIPDDFPAGSSVPVLEFAECDGIVLTQTCDLANSKTNTVLVAQAVTVKELRASGSNGYKDADLKQIADSRLFLQCLLGPIDPNEADQCVLVDFRKVHSLPLAYLRKHAAQFSSRQRLTPPHREFLAQAYARSIMRIAIQKPVAEYFSKR